MQRRELIGSLGSLAAAAMLGTRSGFAQSQSRNPGRIYRLGTFHPVVPMTESTPFGKIIVKVLAQHGYIPGQNLAIEARSSMGDNAKIPASMQELKAANVDAIIVIGFPAALAAKSIGVPTIGANGLGDPVATHLIENEAHPGGNITGISDVASVLTTKRLSLLKEVAPKLRKIAMIWNEDDLGMTLRYQASAKGAEAIGAEVLAVGVREPDDFKGAFEVMGRERPDGILMVADALTNLNRKRVFEFAAARKLPAIYEYDFIVRDGGLMSYGPDLTESFERAAALAARIFAGAKPADLPFEQPTLYPFAINLKTAKATGIEIPPTLLALADQVIE
jgi:putative tryptophan/tyrosine transport system substrate-binding protein